MDEYYYWLAFEHTLRNKPAFSKKLIERFSTPDEVFAASDEELCTVEGITSELVRKIKSVVHPVKDVTDEIKIIRENGIQLIYLNHPDYPEILKNIIDPPICFYMKGGITQGDAKAIAIVGTRRPTTYGRKVTEKIASELSSAGFTIVSGMARGIDSAAHQSVIKTGGRSIGVLGCGIDVVYPPENSRLFAEMPEYGAIISEFAPGTGPQKQNFPQRNRIISGLSLGTVVIEAAERSGSLITVRFALEQGREVFAVPGNINSPVSMGTNNLIKQGAKLVTSTEDILEEFEQLLTQGLINVIKNSYLEKISLSKDENNIYNTLTLEPKHIDQIITESGIEPRDTIQLLLNLEIKGVAEQVAGSCYVKAKL
ncbi:MAG: DNA-protecting protein DprA [Nitrospirae bacterium]|nr:DNA-protecting protein DprA [Nitrospirota bacterium]